MLDYGILPIMAFYNKYLKLKLGEYSHVKFSLAELWSSIQFSSTTIVQLFHSMLFGKIYFDLPIYNSLLPHPGT